MPWHVARTAKCPASKPWGVIKDSDGSVAGCHPAKEAAGKQMAALYANENSGGPSMAEQRVKKPYADVPYADPGYLDANGEQVSKSGKEGVARYPLTPDKVMAAWTYINQAKNAAQYTAAQLSAIKGRIKAAMKKHGHKVSEAAGAGADGEERLGGATAHPASTEKLHEYWVHGEGAAKIRWGEPGDFQRCVDHLEKYMPGRAQGYCNLAHKAALGFYPATHAKMEKHAVDLEDGECVRSVPFELTGSGDGLTLEGYAAVFNRTARISDRGGEFDEQIAPGAFTESLARRKPVLMFEHGKHPLIGSMPLGRIDDIHEDARGLFISARLSDNWLIQPVRDAVRDGAVNGMSFRFYSPGEADQRWEKRDGKPDLRTLLRLDPPELGPVVFPAYEPTTATIRSLLDGLEDFTGRAGVRSAPAAGGEQEEDVQPGNGRPSPTHKAALRDRAWRMRRQLND